MRERPLEYFRPQNLKYNTFEDAVGRWYIARAFVLELLEDVSFSPGENDHLHVVIDGDSPMMLAILRQVALSAHYPNYVEYDSFDRLVCKNRTVITLKSNKTAKDIVDELSQGENLSNLMSYVKYSVFGSVNNEESFLDLELEIVHELKTESRCISICEDDIRAFIAGKSTEEIYTIDTRMAVYASKVYDLGALVDNIPYEDLFCTERYSHALNTFRFRVLEGDGENLQLINKKWTDNQSDVREGLSNLFCADCFISRELAIKRMDSEYENLNEKNKNALWAKYNYELSLSEHSRWNVEKLILGYNPLTGEKKNIYERMLDKQRKAYEKSLKKDRDTPFHIDLCSYKELRRLDPNNLKYDSFLMLAIPIILNKTRE